MPFRAPSVELLVDDPALDELLRARRRRDRPASPLLVRLGVAPARRARTATEAERDLATALLAWAPPFEDLAALVGRDRRRCGRGSPSSAATTPGSRWRPPTRPRAPSSTTSRSSAWRRAASRAGGPIADAEEPGPGAGGGATPRLRGVDPGAADAHLELRPGGALPVPARGVQPRGARARRPVADRRRPRLISRSSRSIASRNGSVSSAGSDVADRVLRAVGRARPHRRGAKPAQVVVAQPIRQRLEERDPAACAAVPGRGQQAVGMARGDQRQVVDERVLVARRADGRGSAVRHPPAAVAAVGPGAAPAARGAAAAAACAPSR